ncbi:putative leucine-rich repeat domain, L domain-containing protein [Rosa chinensis]|nr:putative leucine-rich repeat domain, L domain-containing protein [Rosa chinensis]
MWMAQGFLHSSTRNEQDFEEIGLDYMRQLCSRSFFHIEEDDFFCMRFKMHDLIHDLAILVAQVEYLSVNFHQSGSFDRVRHLSIYTKDLSDNEEVPDFILQLGKVRTILIPEEKVGITGRSFIKKCISRFKYLRLLNLRSSTFDELPSSIGNLSHLRYVDLSYNCHIKRVPDCICKLQHLQTLLLSHCEELEKFPKDIGNLISLRYLALTTKKTCLPTGIDRLTSLRILHVVACRNLLSLEGLPRLTHLKMFIIEECPVLRSLPHNMKYSTALETLIISDCEKLDLLSLEECVRGLRSFWILKSKLKNFPLWLKECASTLQNICIANCQNLIALPEWLQSFKLLEKLVIENCPQVPALPEGMHCLTTLRELKISGCPRLMERCNRHGGIDWFKIAHVTKIMIGGVNNNTFGGL